MNKLIITNKLPEKDSVGPNEWGCLLEDHIKKTSIPTKVRDKLLETPNGVGPNVNSRLTLISERRSERNNNNNGKEVIGKIINGEQADIIIALDSDIIKDNLFSAKPEKRNLNDYLAFTSVNKFPAGLRCVDECVYKLIESSKINVAFMPCLLTFTTKYPIRLMTFDEGRVNGEINGDYFQEIEKTPISHIEAMLLSMQSSINSYVKKAINNGISEVLIRPFINQGFDAGASLRRLHSQVYIDFTPGHSSNYEAMLKGFARRCNLCTSDHEGRELYNNGYFTVFVTGSPRRNYHLRVASNEHISRFTDFNKKQIKGLADVLKISNSLLSEAGVTKDRNILLQTLYEGYNSNFHFSIDIVPYYPEGSVELFGDISVVWISPLRAANELLEAKKKFNIIDYQY